MWMTEKMNRDPRDFVLVMLLARLQMTCWLILGLECDLLTVSSSCVHTRIYAIAAFYISSNPVACFTQIYIMDRANIYALDPGIHRGLPI